MQSTQSLFVLAQMVGPNSGLALRAKHFALIVLGVIFLAVSAKINVPVWPSPVPVTLGTFAVLSIGAAYGARLGLATIVAYMLVGAAGYDVFAGSSAELSGIDYMMGSTGGYLVGYVLATLMLGALAARGWDRHLVWMALAMLIGNALIYVPGLLWLGQLYGWDNPILAWGLTPFLVGDALKLALAALLFPALWAGVRKLRQ